MAAVALLAGVGLKWQETDRELPEDVAKAVAQKADALEDLAESAAEQIKTALELIGLEPSQSPEEKPPAPKAPEPKPPERQMQEIELVEGGG
jgi:hypothetical protein